MEAICSSEILVTTYKTTVLKPRKDQLFFKIEANILEIIPVFLYAHTLQFHFQSMQDF